MKFNKFSGWLAITVLMAGGTIATACFVESKTVCMPGGTHVAVVDPIPPCNMGGFFYTGAPAYAPEAAYQNCGGSTGSQDGVIVNSIPLYEYAPVPGSPCAMNTTFFGDMTLVCPGTIPYGTACSCTPPPE